MAELLIYQMDPHDLETKSDQESVLFANVHVFGCDLDKFAMAQAVPFYNDQELSRALASILKNCEDACLHLPKEEAGSDAVIKMEEQFSKMVEYLIRLCDDLDDDPLDSLSASCDSDSYFSDDEWSSEDEEDSREIMRKVFLTEVVDEDIDLQELLGGGHIRQLAFWDDDESWTACNGDWKAIMESDLKRFNDLMKEVKLASKEAIEKKREAQLNSLKSILTWEDLDEESEYKEGELDDLDDEGELDDLDEEGELDDLDEEGELDDLDEEGELDDLDEEGELDDLDEEGELDDLDEEGELDDLDEEGELDDLDEEGELDDLDEEGELDDLDEEGELDDLDEEGELDDLDEEGELDDLDEEGELDDLDEEGELDDLDEEGELAALDAEGELAALDAEGELAALDAEGELAALDAEGELAALDAESSLEDQ